MNLPDVRPADESEVDLVGYEESDEGLDLVASLIQASQTVDDKGNPVPIAAGTFAAYGMPDGGFMFVSSVDHGPLAGVKHTRMAPGLVRAISVLAGGGSKLSALRALTRRPRELPR